MIYTYSQLGHHGALGNCLFQVAGVIGTARRDGAKVRLPEDWFYRPFFSLPEEYYGLIDGTEYDFYPDYLQDLRHFEDSSDHIREIFRPVTDKCDELDELTAVHVRRANNLYLPNHHPVCSLEYYEEAMDIVGGEIMVFSDDLEWCKQQSVFKDARFGVGPPKDIDVMELTKADATPSVEAIIDLFIMAQCSNHIISNSTFSWWGAWLANGNRVIYPRSWYGPALSHIDIQGLFPKEWTALC